MKANELMIGDWVYSSTHTPKKVTLQDYYDEAEYLHDGLEGLSPISLTPEILEINGLRYENNYGPFFRSILGDYTKDREPVVCIGWKDGNKMCEWDISDGKGGATYGKRELFVHELQHALRLCGLNELADNFKLNVPK